MRILRCSHGQTVHGRLRAPAGVLGLPALLAALVLLAVLLPAPRAVAAVVDSQPSPLSLGAHGPRVRALQIQLVKLSYLPRSSVDGVFGARTWNAVVALQGWSGIARDGVVGPLTRRRLAHAQRPRPWSTATGIEIHLRRQVLLLVRGGRVLRAIHISSGRPGWETPLGHYRIYARERMSWSRQFEVWMPLAQYFHGGYAIHEYADVPVQPASHGCVRVPPSEAPVVWSFGRLGMRVWTTR